MAHFSSEIKKAVVDQIVNGELSIEQAMHKYNVLAKFTIIRWLRQAQPTISEYLPPTLQMTIVKMEQSIVAGSVAVKSTDLNNEVRDEWEVDPSKNTTINW